MFIVHSQKSCPRFRETTDVDRFWSEFRSGWVLIRDLAAFFSLERRVHEEISNNQSSSTASSNSQINGYHAEEVVPLPQLPIDLNELMLARDFSQANSDESDGLYDRKVRHQFIAARLSDYIGLLLKVPEVLRSKAFEDFLAYNDDRDRSTCEVDDQRQGNTDLKSLKWISDQMSRMVIPSSEKIEPIDQQYIDSDMGRCKKDFYDFLFQGSDLDEVEISIPRRAVFTHYENVPAGWWLVFRITTQSNSPTVLFKLTVCDESFIEYSEGCNVRTDGDSIQHDKTTNDSSSQQSSVLLAEPISQNARILQFSYRCEPRSSNTSRSEELEFDPYQTDSNRVKYALEFSNETNLLRAAQLRLCVMIVPHEAFKAACYAVSDQLEAEKRRQRSPLLSHVLNSFHSDPVCLVVEPFFPEDFLDIDIRGFTSPKVVSETELANSAIQAMPAHREVHKAMKNNEICLQNALSFLQAEDVKNKNKIKELNTAVLELQRKLSLADKERVIMQQEVDKLNHELKEVNRELSTRRQCKSCLSLCNTDASSNKASMRISRLSYDRAGEIQIEHPDKRLNAQLFDLIERKNKLIEASKQNSSGLNQTVLIAKIDKAIELIQTSASLSNAD